MTLQEFRCSHCNKLLAKIEGKAEIICPRCKVLNLYGVPPEAVDTPEIKEQYDAFLRNHLSMAIEIAENILLNGTSESTEKPVGIMSSYNNHSSKGESPDDPLQKAESNASYTDANEEA